MALERFRMIKELFFFILLVHESLDIFTLNLNNHVFTTKFVLHSASTLFLYLLIYFICHGTNQNGIPLESLPQHLYLSDRIRYEIFF